MVPGRGRTGLAPRADQACGNLRRGLRDPWEFGKGVRVVSPGDSDATRCTASAGAVRIPARLFSTDAGSDRRGLDFRGRLETKYTDWRRSPGSTAIRRGEMRVIKLDRPADRDPYSDRHKPDRLRDSSSLRLNTRYLAV